MDSVYPRLTPADRMFLRAEYPEGPQHVAGICLLDGGPLLTAGGELDLGMIQRRLERRLVRVPELRRVVRRPPLLCGPPLWVDDPEFSIDRHVRTARLAPPGDEASLLDTVELLLRPLLDRTHPLWELWLLTGLQPGRLAVLFKVHHAMADGLAALAIIGSMFDLEPDAVDPPLAAWTPTPLASPWALRVDNVRGRLASLGSTLAHPIRLTRSVGSTVRELRRLFGLRNAAPQSSLNTLAGVGRRLRLVHLDLEGARAAAHAHGAKVNDLVLSVVAGGVRDLLVARGETIDRTELVASVPATLRSARTAHELGSASGGFIVRLPIGETDPVRRLELIAASTRTAKAEQRPASVEGLMAWLSSAGLSRRFIDRQRMINLIVTNLPGPPVPLFALGARIEDVMPVVGPAGNVTLVFAALSYCGRLNVVVDADADACPDVDVVTDGMRRTWEELVRS